MKTQPRERAITLKLIVGILLILVLVFAGGKLTYDSFNHLKQSMGQLTETNPKLSALNRILFLISQSENSFRKYTLQRGDSLQGVYEAQMAQIDSTLDELYFLPDTSPNWETKLDSVETLWENKRQKLNRFADLKKNLERYDSYKVVLDKANSDAAKVEEQQAAMPSRGTRQEQEQEAAADSFRPTMPLLFRKFRKPVLNYLKSYFEAQQVPEENTVNLNQLENILDEVKDDDTRYKNMAKYLELTILRDNANITAQIRAIISELERDERMVQREGFRAANAEINRSVNQLFRLTLFTTAAAIILVLLIISDVAKSAKYKRQLRSAKNRAERLSKVKEEFLANMSHEIRTPLNAILGYADQMKGRKLDSTTAHYANIISTSSEHLKTIVDDVLDLSKIESGKMVLEKVGFSIKQIVQEVASLLSMKAEDKGISLEVFTNELTVTNVLGDPHRLRQILLNLAGNAIKFTEEGFVEIAASSELDHETEMLSVTISITDTGIGIPPEKQHLIFEDFSQADSSTTRKFGGTGLGLSISKQLAALHDGQISVESDGVNGSEFKVQLYYPIAQGELAPTATGKRERPPLPQDLRLLVVDDDPVNLQLSQLILDKHGIAADYANSGSKALQLFAQHGYGLVFTDIQMPEIGGIELTEKLRSWPDTAKTKVPIVALTANVMPEKLAQFKKAGIDSTLLKPYKESDLIDKLYEMLVGKHAEAPQSGIKPIPEAQKHAFKDPIFTLEGYAGFCAGDDHEMQLLLTSFLENDRAHLTQMRQMLSEKNTAQISFVAHKMITHYRNLGVSKAIPILAQLEMTDPEAEWSPSLEKNVKRLLNIGTVLHQKLGEYLHQQQAS